MLTLAAPRGSSRVAGGGRAFGGYIGFFSTVPIVSGCGLVNSHYYFDVLRSHVLQKPTRVPCRYTMLRLLEVQALLSRTLGQAVETFDHTLFIPRVRSRERLLAYRRRVRQRSAGLASRGSPSVRNEDLAP